MVPVPASSAAAARPGTTGQGDWRPFMESPSGSSDWGARASSWSSPRIGADGGRPRPQTRAPALLDRAQDAAGVEADGVRTEDGGAPRLAGGRHRVGGEAEVVVVG